MNKNRTALISSIIEKRRPLVEKIACVEANLKLLDSALHRLEQERNYLLGVVDDLDIITRLKDIDFTNNYLSILNELAAIGKLKVRFERNTINLGVVGRARQGKSRLLQSLTGLTAAEIPDGNRQHCTGVRSTILHHPSVETYGEVWFYSERSFLDEVIAPYYEKLSLGTKPLTLEEFAQQPLPPLPGNLPGYAEPGAMYESLSKYHSNLAKYRHLLGAASPRRITKAEIREFVAQDTADGKRVFFNYLAVQEVKIFCHFPQADVGQIALVDMPGLGDTGIGDEERLVKTLGQEIDAVIFVRLPKSSGDYWADVDVKLYDTARAALVELPLNLWSFMVLNHTSADSPNGDNWNNCKDLADTLTEKHLSVVELAIANCADAQECNTKILSPVLDYLAANITTLDQQYAAACQQRLVRLQQQIQVQLQQARQIFSQGMPREHWFPLFLELFSQLWNELTSGLEGLLRQLKQERDAQDLDFKQRVYAAIAACRQDPGIPTIGDIEARRDRVGGYPNAYYEYLNEIRAHLSLHFLSLDQGLKQCMERTKSQVAEVLQTKGRLAGVTEARGTDLLEAIADLLPESLGKLKFGFQILCQFDLSYRGLIQHRIRKHLDGLTPDETTLQLSKTPSAQEILANLQTLHAEAVYGCETALEDLLSEPSQAAFAIVEEFVDRVLRAEGVETEWRIFYEQVRAEVWQVEFEQLGERTRLRQKWLDSVERATAASQLNLMSFLDESFLGK